MILGLPGKVVRAGLQMRDAVRWGGSTPHAIEVPWLDQSDASEQILKRTQDPYLATHARALYQEGLARIPSAVSPQLCDQLIEEFNSYCSATPASREYKDGKGFHSRLCNFHLTSDTALSIATSGRLMELLDFLLGYRSAIYSSLTFEKGSQQAIHRDCPYFHTRPENFFFGLWIALEDVKPGAGPLVYYPEGHRIAADRRAASEPFRAAKDVGSMLKRYNGGVQADCEKAGLKLTSVELKKGDAAIWHPLLPHGGSPIADPNLTRKSIVFHCVPEGLEVHGIEPFFGLSDENALPRFTSRYRKTGSRKFIDQGLPRFDLNN